MLTCLLAMLLPFLICQSCILTQTFALQDVTEHNGSINLGDSAEASTFAAGALVYYRDKNNEILQVSIKCVHYDDDPPYFTISLPSGQEKQTLKEQLRARREELVCDTSIADSLQPLPPESSTEDVANLPSPSSSSAEVNCMECDGPAASNFASDHSCCHNCCSAEAHCASSHNAPRSSEETVQPDRPQFPAVDDLSEVGIEDVCRSTTVGELLAVISRQLRLPHGSREKLRMVLIQSQDVLHARYNVPHAGADLPPVQTLQRDATVEQVNLFNNVPEHRGHK